jgi:FkbM family methyltransferase
MDKRLAELLGHQPGVFFEAGAHDGYTQSNTYFLERYRGWRGVLVEAIPELHAKAARRRPASYVANAALVGPDQAGTTVALQFGDLMSQLGDDDNHATGGLRNAGRAGYRVEVPGCTISDVLDTAGVGRVDLMILDIEGHELEALRGLDHDRHHVELLVIEMLALSAQRPTFDHLLGDRYEFVEKLSADDALYRRRA